MGKMKFVEGENVSRLLEGISIPKMFHAKQEFDNAKITPEGIPAVAHRGLSRPGTGETIRLGMSITVTAGSRGVASMNVITRAIMDFCKEKGAHPFTVPATGSHGGALAEGQKKLLAGYDIAEESMGCPIKSSMEIVLLGYSQYGKPVYQDRHAYEADGIIISCRIKPHNAFRDPYESGVCKMMVVGLGKQTGTESIHNDGLGNMARNLPASIRVVLERSSILLAIPCVESTYDETSIIEAIPREAIMDREPELLKTVFSNMSGILVGEADILIVNEMGENFSGTEVDPDISGTWSTEFGKGDLKVKRTRFLDLTDYSHDNTNGMGLADIITARLYEKLDPKVIYPNCFTSIVLRSGMMLPVVATDKEAIQVCIRAVNQINRDNCRIIRIKNTLHVGRIMLSQVYYKDVVRGRYKGVTTVSEPEELRSDPQENLITPILS